MQLPIILTKPQSNKLLKTKQGSFIEFFLVLVGGSKLCLMVGNTDKKWCTTLTYNFIDEINQGLTLCKEEKKIGKVLSSKRERLGPLTY